MGLLDHVTSSSQPTEAGGASGLLSHVLEIVNNPATGGISGFAKQFHTVGLGSVIASWIGTGPNQSISPDQLDHVLGSERIQAIATKLGVSSETATTQLTTILPQVIDRLTPHGTVPQGNLLDQALAALRSKMPAS